MAMKTAKTERFWPCQRPEANAEAVIEAGRVNLAKKSPNDLKEAAATSKRLRRHPSAAESDQICGFENWLVILCIGLNQKSIWEKTLILLCRFIFNCLELPSSRLFWSNVYVRKRSF